MRCMLESIHRHNNKKSLVNPVTTPKKTIPFILCTAKKVLHSWNSWSSWLSSPSSQQRVSHSMVNLSKELVIRLVSLISMPSISSSSMPYNQNELSLMMLANSLSMSKKWQVKISSKNSAQQQLLVSRRMAKLQLHVVIFICLVMVVLDISLLQLLKAQTILENTVLMM